MEEIKKGIRVLSKGKYYAFEKELKGVFSEEDSGKILEMLKSIMKFEGAAVMEVDQFAGGPRPGTLQPRLGHSRDETQTATDGC